MMLLILTALFALVFVGCTEESHLHPTLRKTKHVSCIYKIEPDGSMDVNNSQKADKCAEKLWNNQKFYEAQIDSYEIWRLETENKAQE